MKNERTGFTLAELLIGAVILMIGIVAMLSALVSQSTLNEHARNVTWALNDANRVMEALRQQYTGCTPPPTAVQANPSWDNWLVSNGGKSLDPSAVADDRDQEYLIVSSSGTDPLQITVAVCWRHRNRTLGECSWTGTQLTPSDTNGNGVIESPAMLSTLMTCRK